MHKSQSLFCLRTVPHKTSMLIPYEQQFIQTFHHNGNLITEQGTGEQNKRRRPLTYWDRGFESHRGHGYLSVVSVVCCQVEVSATS
jgi:hypothetical protein